MVAAAARIRDAARAVERALERVSGPAFQDARLDVAAQLGRLVFPGFIAWAGLQRLGDVERYLRGAVRRLERLPDAVAVDRDRMRAIHELEAAYRARLDTWPTSVPLHPSLADVPWMLEELRVAQFAQAVGVRGQVSAKKIRRAIEGRA